MTGSLGPYERPRVCAGAAIGLFARNRHYAIAPAGDPRIEARAADGAVAEASIARHLVVSLSAWS